MALRKWERKIRYIPSEEMEEAVQVEEPEISIPEVEEEGKEHEKLEEFEIRPPGEEDTMTAHGGADITQEVEKGESAGGEKESERGESEAQEEGESEGEGHGIMLEEGEEWGEDIESEGTPGMRNAQRVFNLAEDAWMERRLASEFARVIEKVAEDYARYKTEGEEIYDIERLMLRPYEKKPLHYYMCGLERECIIVMLDTSGSCAQQAEFYKRIAKIAVKRKDVGLYETPNGVIEAKWVWEKGTMVEVPPDVRSHKDFKNRVILYFGDFDGGDTVVELSFQNKVYWFSSEDRYEDMDEHDWCSYTLKDFKGVYIECLNENQFFKGIRKIR